MSKSVKIGVFVLGPLDHSPRMLNHACSFAANTNCKVDFVGYEGTSMPKDLPEISLIHIDNSLINKLKLLPRVFYLVYAILRILIQIWQLFSILVRADHDVILVQNPPCIPILLVMVIYKSIRRLMGRHIELIVDWHNYGYTIM